MSDGVIVTVVWTIKPERVDEFVEALRGMFPVTRLHKGFRNIRLVPSVTDANSFLLIEEWDEAQDFQNYGQFRVETGDTGRLLDMTASYPEVGVWSGAAVAEAKG